jgi:hypothetical protein
MEHKAHLPYKEAALLVGLSVKCLYRPTKGKNIRLRAGGKHGDGL